MEKYTTEVVYKTLEELVLLDRSGDNAFNSMEENSKSKNIKDTPHKEVRNELENLEDDIPF